MPWFHEMMKGGRVHKKKIHKTIVVLLLAFLSKAALADALTAQAGSLLDQGRAAEAYAVLEPQEAARAGDAEFDLLFGIAALDIGQHTRGVFALERVLAVQPGNSRARAEIARAYLALGETAVAKREFESVQKQGVPPEVSATIDRFLDAVDRVDAVTRTTLRGFVEASAGYDSNVNSATSKGSMATPLFGGSVWLLDADSKATNAWFGTVSGGMSARVPLSNEVALVGGLSGVLRNNFGAGQFDNMNADAYAGVLLTKDRNVFSFNAQFNQYQLASDRYRTASGLSGQWQYNMDARNQLSVFVQYSDLRYPTQSVRNADRWVAGSAFAHAYRGGQVAYVSAYWVSERPNGSDVPWLGFDGAGLRFGGQMNLSQRSELFAGAAIESRRYNADDPFLGSERRDTQYDLVAGLNYTPARSWKITPKLSWTFNDSNSALNNYHRETVSVIVRRDF